MDDYLRENEYENDFSGLRRHHEIYMSDARLVVPEKMENGYQASGEEAVNKT